MNRLKTLLTAFLTMFKIGLFTFGGGYAMIAVIEREIVEKKKWLTHDEYMDIIAIAESSPGPIAINLATFVGYKVEKVLGSIFATIGVVLPSFIIIFAISFFFEQFLALEYVGYAFKGIQACVGFIILSAGIKMLNKLKKDKLSIIFFALFIIAFILLKLFNIAFSTIYFILIGGGIGVIMYLVRFFKNKSKRGIE